MMASSALQQIEDPSEGSPIVDFFSGPTAQDKLRSRAYDLMQRSAANPQQQVLIAREASAIEQGTRTHPQYEADLARDAVRKIIWKNATELGVDASDPAKFSDIAISTILRHGYPGAERDAALVLQWRHMREAQINALDLQKAQIEKLKADPTGRGDYFVPVETASGVKAFDTRRGQFTEPTTGRKISGAPVVGTKSDPQIQGDIAFAKESGQEGSKNLFAQRQLATDAVVSLQGIDEARKLLDAGMATGKFANFEVGLGATLNELGISYKQDAVENAQAFTAAQSKQVASIIKAFGAGTGLSDADREFAVKAAGGDITFNEKSIRRVLDINERASRNVLKRYKDLQGRIKGKYVPFDVSVDEPVAEKSAVDERNAKLEALLKKYGKTKNGK